MNESRTSKCAKVWWDGAGVAGLEFLHISVFRPPAFGLVGFLGSSRARNSEGPWPPVLLSKYSCALINILLHQVTISFKEPWLACRVKPYLAIPKTFPKHSAF